MPIRAIITDSFSGLTARSLAAYSGKYHVLAVCYKEKTMRHLALSYGVEAIFMPEKANGQAYYFAALQKLLDDGVLSENEMVSYLSGGKKGTQTSFLEINVVGDVLKHAMEDVLPNLTRYLNYLPNMQETDRLDQYILEHIDEESEYLKALYRDTHVKLLRPRMASGHLQGRLLKMLVRMIRPRRILEIGTYSGYSALCIAEGLEPDGRLYTFEIKDEQEDFTRPWIENSPYASQIEFIIGDALKRVPEMGLTFDMAFVDGDKRRYTDYYEMILPRLEPGGYILADNTLWDGHVLEPPPHKDAQTRGIMDFNNRIAADSRLEIVILPFRDGLTLIRKK